jgi:hypothetical protein
MHFRYIQDPLDFHSPRVYSVDYHDVFSKQGEIEHGRGEMNGPFQSSYCFLLFHWSHDIYGDTGSTETENEGDSQRGYDTAPNRDFDNWNYYALIYTNAFLSHYNVSLTGMLFTNYWNDTPAEAVLEEI